jgi:uncharacterized protein
MNVFARRRVRVGAVVGLGSALLFPLLGRFTHHGGETVILLMPPALGALLWWGWPRVRRIRPRQYVLYLLVMVPVLSAAVGFAAYMAGGRILWIEVFWALYFLIAWRLAWAVWSRTEGRLGERLRRWSRRARKQSGGLRRIPNRRNRRLALLGLAVGPGRFLLTALVFAPLLFGALIHRIKIGNRADLGEYAAWPMESVTFTTADGIRLSGWFLPEPGSDATAVICHGSGANKGNFLEFMSVFHGRGYSSLIFDFRGHGDSDGHTCTFGLFEAADVRAAVDWLKAERPQYARHVYGLGSSMGAMALVRAAARDERIEAVVLDSCFTSAPLLARQHLGRIPVLGPLLADVALAAFSLHAGASIWRVDASTMIGDLAPRPVLLIHGADDFVIPPENLTRLYGLARPPKQQWLGPGPHSNIMTTDFYGYTQRVIEFLDRTRPQ